LQTVLRIHDEHYEQISSNPKVVVLEPFLEQLYFEFNLNSVHSLTCACAD